MNEFFITEKLKENGMNFLIVENEKKQKEDFISGRQVLHWSTSKFMQAFPVKLPIT